MKNLDTLIVTLLLLYWAYFIVIAFIYRKRIDPFYVAFISPFNPVVMVCERLIAPPRKK